MAVTLHVLAQPTQRAMTPTIEKRSVGSARACVRRNREMWRNALADGEESFTALVLDAEGLPLKCWDFPRGGWGDDGTETGRAELREMRAAKAAE